MVTLTHSSNGTEDPAQGAPALWSNRGERFTDHPEALLRFLARDMLDGIRLELYYIGVPEGTEVVFYVQVTPAVIRLLHSGVDSRVLQNNLLKQFLKDHPGVVRYLWVITDHRHHRNQGVMPEALVRQVPCVRTEWLFATPAFQDPRIQFLALTTRHIAERAYLDVVLRSQISAHQEARGETITKSATMEEQLQAVTARTAVLEDRLSVALAQVADLETENTRLVNASLRDACLIADGDERNRLLDEKCSDLQESSRRYLEEIEHLTWQVGNLHTQFARVWKIKEMMIAALVSLRQQPNNSQFYVGVRGTLDALLCTSVSLPGQVPVGSPRPPVTPEDDALGVSLEQETMPPGGRNHNPSPPERIPL
jgi:hypothetical protein